MSVLNRDQILQKRELPRENVHIEQWGGDVIVRALSGKERDDFEQSTFKSDGQKVKQNLTNVRARLCVRTIIDESGKRVFNDSDAAALGEQDACIVNKLYEVAARLSGIRKEDIEEIAENFEKDPADSSTSA